MGITAIATDITMIYKVDMTAPKKKLKVTPRMHHLYPEHTDMVKKIAKREDGGKGVSESEAVRRAIAFYYNHA